MLRNFTLLSLFFVLLNVSAFAWTPPAPFLVELSTTPASLRDLPIKISEAYPNPARDYINFDYRWSMDLEEAKIILHNVVGSVVGEYQLDSFETNLSISVSNLESGIYFYTLVVDRQNVLTRKVIVRH